MLDTAEKRREANTAETETLTYMPGFGNDFETESLPGALPQGQNSPQKCNYGLYAEQLSGSPFTAPRGTNERSWLYRIRPSVRHTGRFRKIDYPHWKTAPHVVEHSLALGQLRWSPLPVPTGELNFLEGVRTMTTAGDVLTQVGMAAHAYVFNADMEDDYFFNADGELLIVPETGAIRVFTELGKMDVAPSEICLVPRGTMFKVSCLGEEKAWRGYICENYGAKFTLPDRGPIGANCLANPRDFKTPVAAFEDKETPCRVQVKWCGSFHVVEIGHSPLDVVAWHGNYAPYKYDLKTFSPVGAILFDHPDPSIFTVLTAPSGEEGTANIDFVLFPPRWLVAEHTFRPPWYHRNIMSEFMGLIYGRYDAKEEGFVPGGMSLHNMMLAHGPDFSGFEKASNAELKPVKLDNTMAFMFETRFPQQLTTFAAELETLQDDYIDCWSGLDRKFDGTPGIK
ncbi:homogentisate 1,2-dioxygenase [Sinorhizobium glycinis]|uniref:Homogentisate 1,2-dioxygenase n=1 Tax=Sinorhizobium glycinis TaxID=1472378 RepID=A0A178XSG3_9HYPH|nr:homogentisate 1,2-dioxygenase [Sinorhizobium glycinis]OAP37702.1 homogentisate 1,2-dioxygenase [Sinorhizobium glycinis]